MSHLVTFTAWTYDRRYHVLERAIRIEGQPSMDGSLIYRVPPCATLIEPPEEPEGQRAVFLDTQQRWILIEDHRGEIWFDDFGRECPVDRLGDPGNWGWRRDKAEARRA